jgi:hypothetical protein
MGTSMAEERYASILASYRPRAQRERDDWVNEYSALRDFIGAGADIPLPRLFRVPYVPQFHRSFLKSATIPSRKVSNDCPRC